MMRLMFTEKADKMKERRTKDELIGESRQVVWSIHPAPTCIDIYVVLQVR